MRVGSTSLWVPLAACLWAAGCGMSDRQLCRAFQDEDPDARIAAVLHVNRTRNLQALPYVIERLTDEESDVRFAAIRTLEDLTGETKGYRYYDPPDQREQALQRWRQWLLTRDLGEPTTCPARNDG